MASAFNLGYPPEYSLKIFHDFRHHDVYRQVTYFLL
jgi:hypothetical protein